MRRKRSSSKTIRFFHRLRVAELENRLVPSAVFWTGGAGTLQWGDAGNWSTNAVPTVSDDVTINVTVSGPINIGPADFAVRTINDTTASLAITTGGSLTLAAVAATSTVGQNLTVQSGGALTVGSGANVVLQAPFQALLTITDNGTMTFASGDTVTLNTSATNSTAQLVVGNGGLLSASGTAFSSTGAPILVNSGGHLEAQNCSFAVGQVALADGVVFNSGDLTNNVFSTTLNTPILDVPLLISNQSFHDVNVNSGDSLASGQAVTLTVMGTASTANLSYIFPGTFTIDQGAALSVAANVHVTIQGPYGGTGTLTDNGTLTFATGDTVTLDANALNAHAQLVVGNGGLLEASSTAFGPLSSNTPTQMMVNAGGHLQADHCSFAGDQLSLADGVVLNSGDLTSNIFNTTLFAPLLAVPLLTNNQSFHNVDFNPGDSLASGQALTLPSMGTAATGNLVYVLPPNLTISQGASLTVASNVRVTIPGPYGGTATVTVNGTLAFASGDTVTLDANALNAHAQLVVGNGGLVSAEDTVFESASGGTSTQLIVRAGGSFQANNSTVTLANLTLNNSSIATLSGDIVSGVFTINSGGTISIANNDFSNLGNNGLVAVGDPNAIIHLENNYWGTTVNSQIAAKILDHNDDATRPTVSFSPALTSLATNQPPVLSTITNQTINEGSTLSFTASASDADGDSITYSLDPGAPIGASINATTGLFSYTPDDGPATYTVVVRATDNGSPPLSAVQAFTITVNNVAPTASLSGPIDGFQGVEGQEREFIVGATDASPADQAAGFTYAVHWGDGTADTILSGLTGTHVTHVFAAAGTYTITATATDKDGGRSAATSINRTVNIAEVQNGTLIIGGTAANDAFDLTPGTNTNDMAVTVNGTALGVFSTAGQVQVFGNGGNGDVLNLDDQGNTLADQYVITSTTVGRTGAAMITFSGIGTVNVHAGISSNTIAVQSTAAGTPVNITMGNGANNITVGSGLNTLDNLLGDLTVTGGTGNNTLSIDDQGSSASETYTIAATTVNRSGAGAIVYSKMKKVLINRSSGHDTVMIVSTASSTPVVTSGGPATLVGPNTTSTWTFTGSDGGTVGMVTFSGVTDVVGGSGSDTFKFKSAGSLSGTVDGGGGSNKLDYSTFVAAITINLQTGAATATGGMLNMTSTIGSTSTANQLIGPNTPNTWSITGVNAGKLNTFAFTGFANLTGGIDSDVFKFSNATYVSGAIDGGGGGDWLDYSAYTTAITVNLVTGAATAVNGGVVNIENVRAGKGGSTLTGNAQGNILVGGLGSDTIDGGSGRSLLIGDKGGDTVTGGSDEDIVIGDYTTFDSNNAALMSILAEWQRTDETYSQRVSNLKNGGGLNGAIRLNFGSTVKDDGFADLLTGGPALDWFFKGSNDTITDLQSGEQID